MPIKAYYNANVSCFLEEDPDRILGILTAEHHYTLEELQKQPWLHQLSILKANLTNQQDGRVFIEFYIPRMGKRADVVVVTKNIVS